MNKDYNDFIKTQSIKESILKNTEAWGRTQFVDEIYRLQQENQQLKDTWNELKEYIEQEISVPMGGREFCCYSNVRDKIKELERGVSDEN